MSAELLAGLVVCGLALAMLIPARLDQHKATRRAADAARAEVRARAVAHELSVNARWVG